MRGGREGIYKESIRRIRKRFIAYVPYASLMWGLYIPEKGDKEMRILNVGLSRFVSPM